LTVSIIIIYITTRLKKFILPLLIILFLANLFQITAQYLHDKKSDFSLTNFYGNGPYKPVAEFLKQKLQTDAKILTFDPIGYYWGGQYYDYYEIGAHRPENFPAIIEGLKNNKISAIALPRNNFGDLTFWGNQDNFDINGHVNDRFNFRSIGGESGIDIWY
jgi:hypothetical protein